MGRFSVAPLVFDCMNLISLAIIASTIWPRMCGILRAVCADFDRKCLSTFGRSIVVVTLFWYPTSFVLLLSCIRLAMPLPPLLAVLGRPFCRNPRRVRPADCARPVVRPCCGRLGNSIFSPYSYSYHMCTRAHTCIRIYIARVWHTASRAITCSHLD